MPTLFAWLISHQPAVLFSHNKSAISNQPAVLFSQNKPAAAISHQPTEQAGHQLQFLKIQRAGKKVNKSAYNTLVIYEITQMINNKKVREKQHIDRLARPGADLKRLQQGHMPSLDF
jgi:hypothetical protein